MCHPVVMSKMSKLPPAMQKKAEAMKATKGAKPAAKATAKKGGK